MIWEKTRWPHFSRDEFACRHSGACAMRPDFLDALQDLRRLWGRPMVITSGYRAADHPIEAAKPRPGAHNLGLAADIRASGTAAVHLVALAAARGFSGIGVAQDFVHLDRRTADCGLPYRAPLVFWSYAKGQAA